MKVLLQTFTNPFCNWILFYRLPYYLVHGQQCGQILHLYDTWLRNKNYLSYIHRNEDSCFKWSLHKRKRILKIIVTFLKCQERVNQIYWNIKLISHSNIWKGYLFNYTNIQLKPSVKTKWKLYEMLNSEKHLFTKMYWFWQNSYLYISFYLLAVMQSIYYRWSCN